MKNSTRIMKYESQVVKSNPGIETRQLGSRKFKRDQFTYSFKTEKNSSQ